MGGGTKPNPTISNPTRFTVGFHPTYKVYCWVSPNLQGLLLGFTQPTRFTVGFHPTYKVYCWVSPNLQGLVVG
ncbi:hypothetical protein NIES39_M00440 [Arthrospira platensis NIES-39]|nr:hypothetical protein NIES39_M00440 [Arthrospira platensis NIES-39]